jgi:retron-type reverse transcriptase
MPDDLKESIVVPLLKKKNLDKDQIENYRPISNLPFISKVIERVVASQLTEHLERFDYFEPQQFAYRQHHSCEGALLSVLDSVYASIDNKEVTILVLLDLTAAFDSVDHQILIQRLRVCGVDKLALDWIAQYLSDRNQRVSVNGTLSSSVPLTIGVPQGSVLGPLLFNIYLTGLGKLIASFDVSFVQFADDLQLFLSCSPSGMPQAISRLQNCVAAVINWMKSSLLTVNPKNRNLLSLVLVPPLNKCQSLTSQSIII